MIGFVLGASMTSFDVGHMGKLQNLSQTYFPILFRANLQTFDIFDRGVRAFHCNGPGRTTIDIFLNHSTLYDVDDRTST